MNIKHPFVKPEIECTLAAGCAVTVRAAAAAA